MEEQLRSMGLRVGRRPAPDGVRRPTGDPPPARAGWEGYLVTQKRVGDPWPPEAANQIAAARRCYEAGTHEMLSTTTAEGWTQLYLIPRRQKAPARSYFSTEIAS